MFMFAIIQFNDTISFLFLDSTLRRCFRDGCLHRVRHAEHSREVPEWKPGCGATRSRSVLRCAQHVPPFADHPDAKGRFSGQGFLSPITCYIATSLSSRPSWFKAIHAEANRANHLDQIILEQLLVTLQKLSNLKFAVKNHFKRYFEQPWAISILSQSPARILRSYLKPLVGSIFISGNCERNLLQSFLAACETIFTMLWHLWGSSLVIIFIILQEERKQNERRKRN